MTIIIHINSLKNLFNTKNETTKIKKHFSTKNNMITADIVSFKGVKIGNTQSKQITKSLSNNFLTEVTTVLSTLIGLFKIKDKTIDFKKMSRKEIKTFLAQRQFRLSFASSYEKYNISGKYINLVTKCKKYPEFAKEIFNMKQKNSFCGYRFYEQDIAELFLSYETNPELTKKLIGIKNSDGSAALSAQMISALVELKDDELVQDCLKNLVC